MAERTPPGFTIPLRFYDGPEVRSIPKRIRSAAVGVFALAGNYSATRLSDGYVDNETLREFGCGPAIREALKNTLGREGQPDPIWVEAPNGIRFAKWGKWQRTNAEVTAHREAEAERKRAARAARKGAPPASTNGVLPISDPTVMRQESNSNGLVIDAETLGPAGTSERPAGHLPESGQAETETRDRDKEGGYVSHSSQVEQGAPVREERGQERGRSDPVNVSASKLVSDLVPQNVPAAVKTKLRLEASQLMVGDGLSSEIVAESLRRWVSRPDAGTGLLAHIASSVLREGTAPQPKSKQRDWAELTKDLEAAEQHQQPSRKAIEQ